MSASRRSARAAVAPVLIAALGALAAAGACFSDRQEATGPAGGDCRIPINSSVIGSTAAIVAIQNFGFHPQTVRVRPGTTVTWVNCEREGVDAHTSTSDDGVWDSPFLAPGATFSHTFGQAGQFDYHCVPHPSMQGVVIVE